MLVAANTKQYASKSHSVLSGFSFIIHNNLNRVLLQRLQDNYAVYRDKADVVNHLHANHPFVLCSILSTLGILKTTNLNLKSHFLCGVK